MTNLHGLATAITSSVIHRLRSAGANQKQTWMLSAPNPRGIWQRLAVPVKHFLRWRFAGCEYLSYSTKWLQSVYRRGITMCSCGVTMSGAGQHKHP